MDVRLIFMHILKINARVEIGPKDVIDPGEYMATDTVAAQLLLMADGGTMTPLEQHRPFREDKDWNGKRVMFMRSGGFGDLVLLTPVLREVKRRWPGVHVAVSTMSHYGQVLTGLPFVDEIVPFPLPWNVAEEFDAWVLYENAIEKNPRAKELHATELFGEIAGITEIEDLQPAYHIKPSEVIWATEGHPRTEAKRICIQPSTSARCRIYADMGNVAESLCAKGWEVFLLGAKDAPLEPKLPPDDKLPPGLTNMIQRGLTIRQSVALIATSDVFLGGDSALLHIAGALSIPSIGLYGPFPWRLRTAHSPSIQALSGVGECSPCFHHIGATMRNPFPAHCPSAKTGYCEVLKSIKPERIVAKIEQLEIKPKATQFPNS